MATDGDQDPPYEADQLPPLDDPPPVTAADLTSTADTLTTTSGTASGQTQQTSGDAFQHRRSPSASLSSSGQDNVQDPFNVEAEPAGAAALPPGQPAQPPGAGPQGMDALVSDLSRLSTSPSKQVDFEVRSPTTRDTGTRPKTPLKPATLGDVRRRILPDNRDGADRILSTHGADKHLSTHGADKALLNTITVSRSAETSSTSEVDADDVVSGHPVLDDWVVPDGTAAEAHARLLRQRPGYEHYTGMSSIVASCSRFPTFNIRQDPVPPGMDATFVQEYRRVHAKQQAARTRLSDVKDMRPTPRHQLLQFIRYAHERMMMMLFDSPNTDKPSFLIPPDYPHNEDSNVPQYLKTYSADVKPEAFLRDLFAHAENARLSHDQVRMAISRKIIGSRDSIFDEGNSKVPLATYVARLELQFNLSTAPIEHEKHLTDFQRQKGETIRSAVNRARKHAALAYPEYMEAYKVIRQNAVQQAFYRCLPQALRDSCRKIETQDRLAYRQTDLDRLVQHAEVNEPLATPIAISQLQHEKESGDMEINSAAQSGHHLKAGRRPGRPRPDDNQRRRDQAKSMQSSQRHDKRDSAHQQNRAYQSNFKFPPQSQQGHHQNQGRDPRRHRSGNPPIKHGRVDKAKNRKPRPYLQAPQTAVVPYQPLPAPVDYYYQPQPTYKAQPKYNGPKPNYQRNRYTNPPVRPGDVVKFSSGPGQNVNMSFPRGHGPTYISTNRNGKPRIYHTQYDEMGAPTHLAEIDHHDNESRDETDRSPPITSEQ